MSAVIDARASFDARRCLDGLSEDAIARRARMVARAEGSSIFAERCADLALARFRMGDSVAAAISAARELAISLRGTL